MTDRDTIQLVVKFLGRASLVFGVATAVLVGLVIWLTRGSGTVDPAAVVLVGIVGQPTAAALAALGAVLVSTRSTPTSEEVATALAPLAPLPVTIDQPAGEPVPTAEVAVPKPRPGKPEQ